jgi:ABC-2 type transport system permease protein
MAVMRAHFRYRAVEYMRQPFAIVPTLAFPIMITAFFILPQMGEGFETQALAIVLMLSFLMITVFNFGAGTAEERKLPWDAFMRTLPLRPRTALAARIAVGLAFAVVGALPAILLLVWQASLRVPPAHWPLLAVAVLLGAVAMTGLGLTLGNALPYKAAIATANVVFLPMGFVGGLFIPLEFLPGWAATIGLATPIRPWVEVTVPAAAGVLAPAGWWLALAAWAVTLCGVAGLAYRRDQVQRFT